MQGKEYEDNTIARPTWQYSGFRISNDLGLLFLQIYVTGQMDVNPHLVL